MSGTFGSIGTAASALRYHQSVMEVASGNIANTQIQVVLRPVRTQ